MILNILFEIVITISPLQYRQKAGTSGIWN